MPKVNLEEIEKEAKKSKSEKAEVITTVIDGKSYFQGKVIPDVFDSYDECVNRNQDAKRLKAYADQGLNELGQSKEQVEAGKKRQALVLKRKELMEEVAKIDTQIAALRNPVKEEKKESKKK